MARFPVLSSLVTLLCFLFWTTRVSTPSHSDMSLRTIEIVPLIYPVPTISASTPIRSPCVGINRCKKSPVYKAWASKVVGSVNQARNYLNVRSIIRPYLRQVGRYVHQVTDILGRPTPDSLVGLVLLPTSGKLAAPPVHHWALVEEASVLRLAPPPPPPSRTLPVYFPPAPTSGPWNPPTPASGHGRVKNAEPVVKVNWDEWFQHAVLIGSTLILTTASFVLYFKAALSSVKCVEHRDTENDEVASYRDVIRSAVPLMTKPSASQAIQKPSTTPAINQQQSRTHSPLTVPLAVRSQPVMGEWPLQILGFDTWRAPRLPTRVMTLIRHSLTGMSTVGRHQLPNILSLQPLPQRPHYALNHFDQILSLCVPMELCMPLLIEWPIKPIEVETWTLTPLIIALIPPNTSIIYSHEFLTTFNRIIDFLLRARLQVPQRAGQATEHRRPLPIEWYSTNSDTAKPPEAICPLSSPNTIFPPPLTLVSRTIASIGSIHLLPPPALGFPFPAGLREVLRLTAVQHLRIRANNILCQSEATGQRAPLLIDWYSEKMVDIVPPPKAIEPSPLVTFHLTGDHLHPTLSIQRTSQLLRALAPSSYTHTTFTPRFDHAAYHPPARLLIEWYAHPQVAQPLDDEVKISFPESPTFAPTSAIQLDHQSHPKTPPRIPTSFHRYANIRIEDLDAYPPEQRDEILRREIQLAEDRYRQDKSRRDRARLNIRWKRSEMGRKGDRLSTRRKCKEQLEEEEGLKKVMQARQRGEEEVFEGMGGPSRPVPEWLQVLVEVMCDWGSSGRKEKRMEGGLPKGILKRRVGEEAGKGKEKDKGKGKKSKVVRWVDEFGRRLAR